jgi:hypothetical protein
LPVSEIASLSKPPGPTGFLGSLLGPVSFVPSLSVPLLSVVAPS